MQNSEIRSCQGDCKKDEQRSAVVQASRALAIVIHSTNIYGVSVLCQGPFKELELNR